MTKRILCYGDSNTWGFDIDNQVDRNRFQVRYPSEVRWTGILARQLGDGYTVIEEGLNARSTIWDDPSWPDRNGLTYLRPCLNSHAPIDLVVLMLGTNDLKVRLCGYVPDIARGVSVLIDTIQSGYDGPGGRAPQVLLISPLLVGEWIADNDKELAGEFGGVIACEKSKELSGYYAEVAKQKGCHFLDAAKIASPGSDAIHFDIPGHAALGEAVAKKVAEIFA